MSKLKLTLVGMAFAILSVFIAEKKTSETYPQIRQQTSNIVVSVASMMFFGLAFACKTNK